MQFHILNWRKRRRAIKAFNAMRRAACRKARMPEDMDLPWLKWHLDHFRKSALLKAMPRNSQTLAIIDLQYPDFVGDEPEAQYLIKQAVLQVKLARKLGWPIVLVEFE